MKSTEKAIRDFCGHHADWWPSTTQVQEMLALAQPCPTCEALARTVMLDQTSHDTKRPWVGLTDADIKEIWKGGTMLLPWDMTRALAIEAKLKDKNT
jgi:bacterioferritin-associated ferredoxin